MAPTTRQQSKVDSTPSRAEDKTPSVRKSKRVRYDLKGGLTAKQIVGLGFLAALTIITLFGFLLHKNYIRLEGKTRPEALGPFHARLEFTLRYQVMIAAWLIVSQLLVMMKRVRTNTLDPLSGDGDDVQAEKNILTNSLEQGLTSSLTQFILISYIPTSCIVKVIPGMNLSFLLGRILFWFGYPKYRTCGYVLTFLPILLAHLYNLHKFGQHLGLY